MKEKLVRDNIPRICKEEGRDEEFRKASPSEYNEFLIAKLIEETAEVVEEMNKSSRNRDALIEELADLSQVMDAVLNYYSVPDRRFKAIKTAKFRDKGGFYKRIIMKLK